MPDAPLASTLINHALGTAKPPAALDARNSLRALQQSYTPNTNWFRGMVIGEKGVGKTTLLETCPKPVLHLCLDPGGEQTLQVVDTSNPQRTATNPPWLYPVVESQTLDVAAYDAFDARLRSIISNKLASRFGTICLDSLTTLGDIIVAKVMADAKRAKPTHLDHLELQDYGTIADKAQYFIKTFLNLPTNVLILGHIQEDTDEITHRTIYNVMFPGQKTSQKVPIYTSEIYYMQQEEAQTDPRTKKIIPGVRYLITANNGKFKASTRMGAKGRLEMREPADIGALMRKAGLPTVDLPLDLSDPS